MNHDYQAIHRYLGKTEHGDTSISFQYVTLAVKFIWIRFCSHSLLGCRTSNPRLCNCLPVVQKPIDQI